MVKLFGGVQEAAPPCLRKIVFDRHKIRNLIPFCSKINHNNGNIFFLCVILFSNVLSVPLKVAPGACAPFALPSYATVKNAPLQRVATEGVVDGGSCLGAPNDNCETYFILLSKF